jgi:hypothetical protein
MQHHSTYRVPQLHLKGLLSSSPCTLCTLHGTPAHATSQHVPCTSAAPERAILQFSMYSVYSLWHPMQLHSTYHASQLHLKRLFSSSPCTLHSTPCKRYLSTTPEKGCSPVLRVLCVLYMAPHATSQHVPCMENWRTVFKVQLKGTSCIAWGAM